MGIKEDCKLIKKEELVSGIFKYSVQAPEIAKLAKPGQFLEIKVTKEGVEPFLRRPISIFNLDGDVVEFIFQVKGRGTEILSKRNVGEDINIMGPLGFGTFKINDYKNVAIIGGGIGIYPLYELAKELQGKAQNINIYLGFRNRNLVTNESDFEKVSNKLVIATDDGSYKNKGFAINYLIEDAKQEKPDIIFACGPLPMLKSIREYSIKENIPCQISLEERMGCGIGACLGCAVKIISGKEERFGHVCKEGPVFYATDVEI